MNLARAFVMSYAERYADMAISFVAVMILARIVTPAEVGAYAIAVVIASIIGGVRDFGCVDYLIQAKSVDTVALRTSLTVAVLLGAAWAVALWFAAPLAGSIYGTADVATCLAIGAISFAIVPFCSVTNAMLSRELRFGARAINEVARALVSAVVSIWLALRGHGAIGLAWGGLAGTLAQVLVSLPFWPRGLDLKPSLDHARRLLSFGRHRSTASAFEEVVLRAPDLIIGKMISLEAASLYGRAQSLASLVEQALLQAIYPVSTAHFARLARENTGQLRDAFAHALACVTAVAFAMSAFLAAAAEPLVWLLYGEKWAHAAPLLRYLAFAAAATSITAMTLSLLLATGLVHRTSRMQLLLALMMIAAVTAGAMHGINAALMGVCMASLAGMLYALHELRSHLNFGWRDQLGMLGRAIVLACLVGLVPFAFTQWSAQTNLERFVIVVASALVALAAFTCGARALGHPVYPIVMRVLRKFVSLAGYRGRVDAP